MSRISTRKVPAEGPDRCDLMYVGEAPGRHEDTLGRPFVSKRVARQEGYHDIRSTTAGDLLERYNERHGRGRDTYYLTNLCKYRPPNNKFKAVVGSPQLEEGLEELGDEIARVNPNCIVALGGWPLYYLTGQRGKTPGSGIRRYRGSFLPGTGPAEGRKVFASYHPAYILRAWGANPILHYDIGRAISDSAFPDLNYPEYESYIDPTFDVAQRLVEEAIEAPWTSLDIETFPSRIFSCIGFACSEEWGATFTLRRPDLHGLLQTLWEEQSRKIFQFGTYDVAFMQKFYGWRIGGLYPDGWDTYVAAASLMPEFKRGLDFLASIYTRFPYYKTERKVWKESGNMNDLFEYNIKDVIATYQIAMAQMEEIDELFV